MTRSVNRRPQGGDLARQIGRGLGWFSICLGTAELLAPRRMAHVAGVPGHPGVVARYGLREIATGIGILAARDPSPWIWGRAGGAAMDAGSLALALFGRQSDRSRIARSLALVTGVAALGLACTAVLDHDRKRASREGPQPEDRRDDAPGGFWTAVARMALDFLSHERQAPLRPSAPV
ncbi:MAG: cyclase dehydrase [Acetobacteraceae bacterium]|nr:cyclase dehydrase [Acetobacteraceae bacterium]